MNLSDMDRIGAREAIDGFTKAQRIEAHDLAHTECTNCTAGDISCTFCGGDNIITVDVVSYLQARILWTDEGHVKMATGGVLASGEVGDVQLTTGLKFEALLTNIREGDGYLVVDSENVKPFSIRPRRVGKRTSLDAQCNIVGPTHTL